MKPLRRTHCVLASLASVSRDRVESDWMHDTARCFGYPSYSSRTARKQGRDAARGPSPAHSSCAASPTPTRDDVTSVTGSALHAAGGAARHGQSGPGGPGTDTTATGSAPRAAGGAPASASQARAGRGLTPPPPVRPPRAAGGATRVGPVRPAGSGHPPRHRSGPPARPAVLSPLTTTWLSPAPPAWGYGPWGRAYHHATSAGPECCVHRIASSGRLGVTGRGAGPITTPRLLGRSAVCTGSPAAGDCDGLGLPGRTQSGYLSPSRPGPAGRPSRAAAGPTRCQWDLVPGQPHAVPRWTGAGPAHRRRWGVTAGASPATAARLGWRGPGGARTAGLGRGRRSGPGPWAGS
jgi:hypothetical protein